jgi:glycosyltransferase involved in cell wall biosynthesis
MQFYGFYIFNVEPTIISFIGGYPFFGGFKYENSKFSYQVLPGWFRPKHVFEHLPYWCGIPKIIKRHQFKSALHRLEGRTHHLMVNASDEEALRKQLSIRGGHFSHNIYINENLYKPLNEIKCYDAIYTAQLQKFKRHSLAKDIKRLMVVSYGGDLHSFCPELKHAEYNQEFLPRPELARKYNQSFAGLCLSEVEGAMLSSCEYLFCGIPVVSTPSKGGRDEFFTPENSIIVTPDAQAVAQAVEFWKQKQPEPQAIREQVLEKINRSRKDYCTYISKLIYDEGGGSKDPDELMQRLFSSPDGIQSRYIKLKDLEKLSFEDFKKRFA